jgi:hypothetical protein
VVPGGKRIEPASRQAMFGFRPNHSSNPKNRLHPWPFMRKLVAVVLLLAGCVSPSGDSDPAAAPILRELPCDTAQSRDAAAEAGHHLKDKTSYEREWRKACTSPHGLGDTTPPAVDFAKEQVLLYSWGQKPSAGYAVAITSATLKGGDMEVVVTRDSPGPCPSATVITYPAAAVVIERTNAQVKWVYEDRTRAC